MRIEYFYLVCGFVLLAVIFYLIGKLDMRVLSAAFRRD